MANLILYQEPNSDSTQSAVASPFDFIKSHLTCESNQRNKKANIHVDKYCFGIAMEGAAIISEIDITEQGNSLESTKLSDKTESDENSLSQIGKYEDQNRQNSESNFGGDLSCVAQIPNEDMKTAKSVEDVSSLNNENCEDHEMFSESNSKKELTLESETSNETIKSVPEFQFAEHDLSKESNRSTNRTENSETKSEDVLHEDLNVMLGNFNELTETEVQNEQTEAASLKTLKPVSGKTAEILNKKFTILHEDEFSDSEKDSVDISMVSLLRSTIGELERALRDSRMLIKTRDEDIASLRKEVEKGMFD